MAHITVIIPYYQKDDGILTRALDTIAAQTHRDVSILIVDDESPLSPLPEIARRSAEDRARITMISQPNGGPGAARNTGLVNLPANAVYAAFLDSDDIWEPDHLARADAALAYGFDFFLADYSWGKRDRTRFSETRTAAVMHNREAVEGLPDVYDLTDAFAELILTQWPAHISATVIRVSRLGSVRFDPRLRRSSEDQMYFLECAHSGARIAASYHVGMYLSDGFNLYRNHPSGSARFSEARLANIYFHRLLSLNELTSVAPLRQANQRHIRQNVVDFVKSEVKYSLNTRKLNIPRWRKLLVLLASHDKSLEAPF